MLLEPAQARLPLPLLLGDPAAQLLHALDVQPARPPLTIDPLMDQPATPQDADVAGDGLGGQVERLGQLSDGRLASGQPGDDRPASPIPKSRESRIQIGVNLNLDLDVWSSRHDLDAIHNQTLVQRSR